MSIWDHLFKWSGEVLIARRRSFFVCPMCQATIESPSGEIAAAFCDLPRAKALSELPVLGVLLDAPETGPTVYPREEPNS